MPDPDTEVRVELRDGMLAKGLEVLQSDTPDREWVAVIVGPDGACLSVADSFYALLRSLPNVPCAYFNDENGECSCEDCMNEGDDCPHEDVGNWKECQEYEEAP